MYGMYTVYVFFFKQKTAYEMRISDWSSDVCSSDLKIVRATNGATDLTLCVRLRVSSDYSKLSLASKFGVGVEEAPALLLATRQVADALSICFHVGSQAMTPHRSEEHTSELQSLMRISYAVFCLKKKKTH